MNYTMLDSILEHWANRHSLHLYKVYKGEEVRSVDVVSSTGKPFQLWLDVPDSKGRTVIYVWDYRKRKVRFDSDISNLDTQLECAYSQIKSWF